MREMNRLSALKVKSITAPGRYPDGGNLYLNVGNGGRSYVFLYRNRATGRLHEMGLGSAAIISLQDARHRAAAARKLLSDGIDPLTAKRAGRATARSQKPFGEFADKFLESIAPGFTDAKHRSHWAKTLKVLAAPLRPMLLNTITTSDVYAVLAPIWNTTHETAARSRGRIERVLEAAKASGLRTGDNPAAWKNNLQALLRRPKGPAKHHAALPYDEMPSFMAALRQREGIAALALEFVVLTAARTGEVTGATWAEIDLESSKWTVPAHRMKTKTEHVVPLADRAVKILRALKPGKPGALLFPGGKAGGPLSEMALRAALRAVRKGATVHGMRSSFKDWASEEAHYDNIVSEMALAHAVGSAVEAAYRRGDLFQKRRALMAEWALFLDGKAPSKE